MKYTAAFFEIQIVFAEQIARQFSIPIETALWNYTTLSKSLDIEGDTDKQDFMRGYQESGDRPLWTYQFYMSRKGRRDLLSPDGTFDGNKLYGSFYYVVREEHILRPHFIKYGVVKQSLFGREQMTLRVSELTAMFADIKSKLPHVDVVLGNSWLYNLDAYRRLFPPEYTKNREVSLRDEFPYLALWGQCYDRDWNARTDVVEELLRNLARVDRVEDILGCFPFPILMPTCSISHFYDFYGV